MTNKQLADFLSWMFARNIITYEEFTQLQLKSLPFLKG